MIGLIKKDFLMIKGNIKYILIVFLIFSLIFNNNLNMIEFVPIFISTMLCMSLFSYDEFNKWDAYGSTLPNGRINIVKSKYLTNIAVVLISFFFTLLVSSALNIIKYNATLNDTINTLYGIAFASVLLITFTYPIIFKYGIEKGRIVLFILIVAITAFGNLLFNDLNLNIPEKLLEIFNKYYLTIIPLISMIILYISYIISKNIYLKKEF